jgi:hypothetical protein
MDISKLYISKKLLMKYKRYIKGVPDKLTAREGIKIAMGIRALEGLLPAYQIADLRLLKDDETFPQKSIKSIASQP